MTQSQPTLPKTRHVKDGDYYFLSPDESLDLYVACGGEENCSSDYTIENTEFRIYGIEYIVTGTCRLTIDGQVQELSPGSIFGYGPGVSYQLENTGRTPLVKRFIEFGGEQAAELIKNTLLEKREAVNLRREPWIKEAFQNLQDCGSVSTDNGQLVCGHLLRYLIARLGQVKTLDEASCTPSYMAFETCKSYLENFYADISAAHEVADACNVSHPHLCRLFKRFSDETPTRMLLRLKLTRSVDLLERGNLLIKEIAEKVGFDDQYYFSKRFKEYFGVSPKHYLNSDSLRISA